MEASAKYDFDATAEDELSFRRGDHLIILGTNDDWYKAALNGCEGYVPKNYIDIYLPSWYQEGASRRDAQEKLMAQPVGSFLIRGSQSGAPGKFSISVRHEADVQHFKVMQNSRGQYYLWSEAFPTLNQLVDHYKRNSVSRHSEVFLREPGPQQRGAKDTLPPLPVSHSLPNPKPPQQRGARDSLPPLPVSHCPPNPKPPQRTASSARQVRALYSFQAEERDELDFSAGDIIEVLEKCDQSWWKGQLRGRTGLFPSNYTIPI